MSPIGQIAFVSGAGLTFATLIVLIARRGMLSMRYTLGWLFVAVCVVLGGLFGGLVEVIADAVDVDPVAVVLTGVMAGFLGLTVQLSISVSGLIATVRTLGEANAILEERVRSVEATVSEKPPEKGTGLDGPDASPAQP